MRHAKQLLPLSLPLHHPQPEERNRAFARWIPSLETPPGAADEGPGAFKIPIKIAGAPEQTTWENLARDGVALLRIGLDVVMRKPGVYAEEVERATWWRFWLISGHLRR